MTKDISDILRSWPSEDNDAGARKIVGDDGTELLQLRIDLGILQMCLDGRPDGEKPFGQPSLLEHLTQMAESQSEFKLDGETWSELDREIMQFYHRRRALLILGARSQSDGEPSEAVRCFRRAVRDANHNLRIMDFIRSHCADEEYIEGHERYRPFVLMHRTLAEAQTELLCKDPDQAVESLKTGMDAIEEVYQNAGSPEAARQDPSIMQLRALERQIRREHSIVQTLHEELAAAIEAENFERAAEIRDRLRAKLESKRSLDDG